MNSIFWVATFCLTHCVTDSHDSHHFCQSPIPQAGCASVPVDLLSRTIADLRERRTKQSLVSMQSRFVQVKGPRRCTRLATRVMQPHSHQPPHKRATRETILRTWPLSDVLQTSIRPNDCCVALAYPLGSTFNAAYLFLCRKLRCSCCLGGVTLRCTGLAGEL
ncbi:hypothetical protein B0J12DRAFT_318433 [Macrophomina phaseolina]|uniref:Secreted protein n=1 Tax=Macrophomina phaseolina TaxID=35725 RepID=A0ABQ8FWA4_9PEZI|nr:hypothetical protein B0J12DRAFT_318433 [Macrophomina phaseolina]